MSRKHFVPLFFILLALVVTFAKEIYKPNEAEYNGTATHISDAVSFEAHVSRVIDGDTVEVLYEGKKETLRLIGIDAPEWGPHVSPECFGEEASNWMNELVEGESVVVVTDGTQSNRDMYGRLLGYLYLKDGTFVNQKLIVEGFAREYTFKIPYAYVEQFRGAESEAKLSKKGLWAACL